MKQKIEVELNTRMVVPSPQASASEGEGEVKEDIEIGSSITEILAFLDDGKAYASAPEKRVPQSAQKGELCWYYALNRIRERHGKDARPNADRHVEQIISSYRKELTRAGTISLALNVFSKHFPADKPIGGVSVNHLDKYLQQAERLHPECSGKVEMSLLGKVEMSPFVPRKPTLLRVLNGMENTNANGAIHDEHRRIRAFGSHSQSS